MTTTFDSLPPAAPAARRRGQPRKVDDAKRRKICAMVAIGCDLRQAARDAGCSYPTIRRETLRHPEFRDKLRRAMRNKAEINALRGSSSRLDRMLSEIQQKLRISPARPANDE
jgi:hypothetical protein